MLHIQIACGITYYVYSSTRGPSLRPPESCEAGPAVLTDNCQYPASPSGPVGRSELICEGVDSVPRVNDLGGEQLIRWFISRDAPVIVEDGTRHWEGINNFTSLAVFAKAFIGDPILPSYRSCHFSTNLRLKDMDHVDLLEQLAQGQVDKFYAQWENCNARAYKAFRGKFQRPYFLPSTIGLASSSWVFLSANYSGKMFKPVAIRHDLIIFMQLRGASRVRLEPWEPCTAVCTSFHETLSEGNICESEGISKSIFFKRKKGPGLCSVVFRTRDLLATERSHYQLSYLGPRDVNKPSSILLIACTHIAGNERGQRGGVVSALDSRSGGRRFDSRPCHVAVALGKQFTLTFPSPPTCKMGTQLQASNVQVCWGISGAALWRHSYAE
ncbi:serine/threonine-protein phosphatase [Elysia marginata]|uniref:Serine/threonine-protein phosphatase n=1 Tax=Elysia marginata TaxID=1093978 RepID=A0AAV4JVU1_9GAST|nr:serine/threonine-protein phosphatase [Elysia marginata]